VLVLDTDHLVEFDRGSDAGEVLRQRLDSADEVITTTIIFAEEQFRGWLAQIHRIRDPHQQVVAYERLQRRIEFFAAWEVLPWTEEAADILVDLRRQGIRIGTMDLKIAAIVLSHRATLLSRNLVDFTQVPGLSVEDWTRPES
jgi:tRNA(fMet)-specific endonuclease VapC